MLSSTDQDVAGKLWRSPWFLPGALGVAALAEFLTNRLAQPLVVAATGPGTLAASILTGLSRFCLNFATVLGVMVLASLLLRATQPGGAASRPLGRLSVLSIGSLLCGLAAVLVLFPDGTAAVLEPKRALWLLQLSGTCLAALFVLGLLAPQPVSVSRPIALSYKIGVVLLLLPPLMLLETQWGLFTSLHALQRYGLLMRVYGSVVAVAALGAGALCISTLPLGRRAVVPLIGAVLSTGALTLLLNRQPGLTITLIYMSFELRLPPNPEAYALYLLSFCAWVFAVLSLLVGYKPARRRGLGLLLIGLGGCQARALHQLLFYLAGLLCIVDSLLDQARFLRRAQAAENSSIPTSAA